MSHPEIERVMSKLAGQVKHVVDDAATDAAKDMKALISVPVVRQGKRVIRSRPGQPPRKDSGRLHRTVKAVAAKVAKDMVRAAVETNTPYDRMLEKGTSKMAPRPFAGPIEAKWERILNNRLRIATRRFH